jgi:2-furoyl-CoA dehydrogenase FAD binding subunit
MFVKPFMYERADSLEAASDLLRSFDGYARVIAGGQSLMPMMNLGLLEVDGVIDISRVKDARGIHHDDGTVSIGALTRHAELERNGLVREHQPLITAAASWIGSPRIRSVGTIGGSLVHSDPSAELPLAMVALGAKYTLRTGSETRVVSADEFHVTYFTSSIGDHEVLESVSVPTLGPGWGWGFAEFSRRLGDFAVAAAAVLVRMAEGSIVEARIALSGVDERPVRIGVVEASVLGATKEELDARIGPIEGIHPVSDSASSAEHRSRLARVLTLRALGEAIDRAEVA